jgi:hypothetical protein
MVWINPRRGAAVVLEQVTENLGAWVGDEVRHAAVVHADARPVASIGPPGCMCGVVAAGMDERPVQVFIAFEQIAHRVADERRVRRCSATMVASTDEALVRRSDSSP